MHECHVVFARRVAYLCMHAVLARRVALFKVRVVDPPGGRSRQCIFTRKDNVMEVDPVRWC